MGDETPALATDIVKARFWAKVALRGPDECWEWQNATVPDGYGIFWYARRYHRAHRISAALFGIPTDKLIRHTCDNPLCVNPAHLLPGSPSENTKDCWERGRQKGPSAENAARTHCVHGHPLTGKNLYITKGGKRQCKECVRRRKKELRQQFTKSERRKT